MRGKSNNFDIIRLIAAITVIFSHSFPLSMGYINGHDPDPLYQLTGEISLGHLAVMVFFIISGFLITQSFDRSKDPQLFLKARILRIFPALIFVVLLTVFILGPLVTVLPLHEYLSSKHTYGYFKNITLYFMNYSLPGVFTQNAYPNAINGSLWSLIFEFECYIVVLLLGVTRLLRKEIILFLFVISAVLRCLGSQSLNVETLLFFLAGMIFYIYRKKITLRLNVAFFSSLVVLALLLFYKPFFLPIITICITYIVMYLGFATKIIINGSKYGDFSYGTYIFGFPIQQLVTYYFGGSMNWLVNFFISLPITLIFAVISWHLIEKNALKFKKVRILKNPSFIKQAS